MKEYVATITTKGQVTVPAAIQRYLGVSSHDQLTFVIDDDGSVRVVSVALPDVDSIVGIAGTLERPLSWDEMREIAYEDRDIEERKLAR